MITPSDNPLRSLDEWDDDVLRRYPESSSQPGDQKDADDFRVYDDETPQHVQEFYRANHRNQTVEFNRQQRDKRGRKDGPVRLGVDDSLARRYGARRVSCRHRVSWSFASRGTTL